MGGSRGAESREGKLLPSLRGLGTERHKYSMFITCSVETPQPRTGLSQPAASLETSKEISSTSVASHRHLESSTGYGHTSVGPRAVLTFQGRAEWPKRNHTAHKAWNTAMLPLCGPSQKTSVGPSQPGRNRTARLL